MYRRKRKRLQSQQEINPGVVLDEPGWIYFNRLKFLDDATTTSNADFGLYVPFLTKGHGLLYRKIWYCYGYYPLEDPRLSIVK